jgi:hypothetical protein
MGSALELNSGRKHCPLGCAPGSLECSQLHSWDNAWTQEVQPALAWWGQHSSWQDRGWVVPGQCGIPVDLGALGKWLGGRQSQGRSEEVVAGSHG